jgi:hypothetical protein
MRISSEESKEGEVNIMPVIERGSYVFVSGKGRKRARRMMDALTVSGVRIAYDWTDEKRGESDPELAAELHAAVCGASVVVYLWEADQESARYEAGMAMGLGIPLVVVGGPVSLFFGLPNVIRVDSDADVSAALM